MSEQIDLLLHEEQKLNFEEASEGELSILQSEISKLLLRIREQNEALREDKKYLANALADIAHQLKTPLTSLSLLITLLENTKDERKQKQFLREMKALLLKMDWLILTLLKISKLDASMITFQKEPIEVYTLIQDAIHPLSIQMELHEVEIHTKIAENIILMGDYEWLLEAIENILKNCMESIGEHGSITVECEDIVLYTEIRIHDSGMGFKKEDLPYIFDRFYRGKSQNNTGYGIGLALSRMIIKGQDGMISAKNHPKKGALFLIRFPK